MGKFWIQSRELTIKFHHGSTNNLKNQEGLVKGSRHFYMVKEDLVLEVGALIKLDIIGI